jgi:hypothetical protein
MSADPQQAQTVVSFLAPFIPYLVAGATEAAKALGKKAAELGGEAAWRKAQELWNKIVSRPNPKLKAKANVVTVDPADEEERASFARTLLQSLEADPALVTELASLLGREESVQKVIARNRSWVQDIVQKGAGTKLVQADDDSTILGVRQES